MKDPLSHRLHSHELRRRFLSYQHHRHARWQRALFLVLLSLAFATAAASLLLR
ncbi:MAG: hypothetical protein ACI4PZ_04200 [Akkermansia sp.]